MNDLAFGFYFAIVFFSAFGFFMCIWWWLRVKHVTSMYVAVTLFFLSTTLYHTLDAYVRWLSITDVESLVKFTASDLWAYRGAIHLVVLFIFTMQLFGRMLKSYSGIKDLKDVKYRRVDDYPVR